jgi:beta-lactamase class A
MYKSKSFSLLKLTLFIPLMLFVCRLSFAAAQDTSSSTLFHQLEASSEGRIGIYAINTANGEHVQYRSNERFPMGCTSKVVGVAAVLKKSMLDKTLLSQKISYTKKDLVNWNPITEKHLDTGMSISKLCEAAIRYSDNTAMNLLVKNLGGLEQINAFAHSLHNTSFRQDHGWPEEAYAGGARNVDDSSTPKDMVKTLQKLTLGNVLDKPQRNLLISWLKNNTTGNARIRAGTPKSWMVGDKTGTGALYGTTNDLGIIWPPHCAPILIGIYYTSNDKNAAVREDIIAQATRVTIYQLAQHDQCIRVQLEKYK